MNVLASGNTFFIYFSGISAIDSFSPVYWKRGLLEPDFLASENHFVLNARSIGSAFSIYWKYVLNESFITASGNGFSV